MYVNNLSLIKNKWNLTLINNKVAFWERNKGIVTILLFCLQMKINVFHCKCNERIFVIFYLTIFIYKYWLNTAGQTVYLM